MVEIKWCECGCYYPLENDYGVFCIRCSNPVECQLCEDAIAAIAIRFGYPICKDHKKDTEQRVLLKI